MLRPTRDHTHIWAAVVLTGLLALSLALPFQIGQTAAADDGPDNTHPHATATETVTETVTVPGPTVTATATVTVPGPTVTVTADAPPPSATTSPSQTPEPSDMPTETQPASPTPTQPTVPIPTPAGCVKPDATNTGATGTLTTYTGATLVTTPDTVIENKTINGDITIAAANVTVRNSRVNGRILVSTGDDARITRVTATSGVSVSSAHRAVIEHSDFGNADGDDTLHVTSDQGRYIQGVTIRNNYIHDPFVPQGSHYDGLQVRGATNVLVACNNFDLGPYQEGYNAPVYLENDNGGYSNARVVDNWLLGGAFNIMLGGANDNGVVLTGNKVGGPYRWDLCYAPDPSAKPSVQIGNTLNGLPAIPCL